MLCVKYLPGIGAMKVTDEHTAFTRAWQSGELRCGLYQY